MSRLIARVARGLGAAGAVAGCASMTAMMPAAVAAAFSAVGLAGSNAIGRTFAPVSQPLFVVSALLLIVGALSCCRIATGLAVTGSVAAYLGMFVFVDGAAMNRMAAMGGPPRRPRRCSVVVLS